MRRSASFKTWSARFRSNSELFVTLEHMPVDSSALAAFIWGTGTCDLLARRHAQESRPDHQGRSMSSSIPISSHRLSRFIGTSAAPTLIDVRIDAGVLLCLVGAT